MFGVMWPFDLSCSGIAFTGFLLLMLLIKGVLDAGKAAADVAKEVVKDERVQGGFWDWVWTDSKPKE